MENLQKTLKTTPRYQKLLEENGIKTIKDFLQYFPRAYENRTNLQKIKDLALDTNETTSIKAQIIEKKILPRGGKKIYEISIQDTDWYIAYISFFNTYYKVQQLEVWSRYIITGKANYKYWKIIFSHPEASKTEAPEIEEESTKEHYNIGRIYPIYPELQGIKPHRFAQKMRLAKDTIHEHFEEHFPGEFLQEFKLMDTQNTIKNMHYPDTEEDQENAIARIFFDRLLRIQLSSQIKKSEYQKNFIHTQKEKNRESIKHFIENLPFELTQAQKKATKQIIDEMHENKAMLKLLQGDVWSGKTIVATIAAYYTKKIFWWQSVFLAPLEVLASQHHKTLAKLLLPLWIRIEILKGSMTNAQKRLAKENIKNGKIDIIIGTHAILQDDVDFYNLKLVVIDEQHKFGVKQRAFFKKFSSPHILQMSATPIPRSLALAFFGECTVSVIDELPAGRKPITTKIISLTERKKLKPRVLDKTRQWQKVFIVTPLIEESEKMENLRSALEEFEEIKQLYSEIKDQVWLLHWKMKAQEKEEIMQKFKEWKIKILVSTTVIEVGVDIPEATIMIIKNAERFGLSQLHQLRGRIGRSDLQSYCFLETKSKSSDSYKRLKAMEQTNDGFKLAEMDLEHRGAWEILGVRQSGEADIPIHLLSNIKFIEEIQRASLRLLQKYPKLDEIPKLKNFIENKIGDLLA